MQGDFQEQIWPRYDTEQLSEKYTTRRAMDINAPSPAFTLLVLHSARQYQVCF